MSGRTAGKKVSDMNYKTSYYLMRVLGIVGILVMLIGGLTNQLAVGGIGIICVLGGDAADEFLLPLPPLQAGPAQADPAQGPVPSARSP